jgi:hypothetical protein
MFCDNETSISQPFTIGPGSLGAITVSYTITGIIALIFLANVYTIWLIILRLNSQAWPA